MTNKEIIEKVLKEIYDYEKKNMHKSYTNLDFDDWKGQIGSTREMEKAISLTIVEKDAQKDLFIKKLNKDLFNLFDVYEIKIVNDGGEMILREHERKRMIKSEIEKVDKEVFRE